MTNQSPREGWEERFDKEFFTEKQHAIKKEVVLKTTGDPGVAEIMNILIKDQLMISETQLKSFIAEAVSEARKEGAREALKPIIDAWTIRGSRPAYHDEIKQQVSQMWPSLFRAIENAKAQYIREEK